MNFNQLAKDIKSGNFASVYFLMGEETYYIDQLVDLIEANALPEDQRSFNQTILYGRDTDIATILNEAKRYPMMADRVLVIVKEAQNLKKLEELESYVQNPLASTVLVFAYKYKSLDKRKKITKLISNGHVLFESKKLYDNKIPDWIEGHLRERGYQSSMKARLLLTESLGTDLSRIHSELQKLELVVSKGETIDETIVEENIGISKDYNNFELQNALGKMDFLKVMTIQKHFAANKKDHPIVLTVSVLFRYFSRLMMLHQAQDKNPQKLAGLLGVHPYFVNDYLGAIRNYDLKKLARIIGYIRECDAKAKGVGSATTTEGELLKELLYKIVYA